MTDLRKYVGRKIRLVQTIIKIHQLKIEDAGVDSRENIPFIKLENGPVFYGIFPTHSLRKDYWLFSRRLRRKVPQECLRVALDIIIRYQECGLKWGGPNKEAYYDVKPGHIVAEMGAYMGYYCLRLSEKVGSEGQVIAIEPIPENIAILEKNISENNLSNVHIVPKGVWKEKTRLPFRQRNTDKQSGSVYLEYGDQKEQMLEVDTLDNILAEWNVPKVDFMVIQLNGAELEALQGLRNHHPHHLAIAARYNAQGRSDVTKIRDLLNNRGYQVKIHQNRFIFGWIDEK